MVGDISSDMSSVGSLSDKRSQHVQVNITEDLEKASHNNGHVPHEGRKHSRVDREEDEEDEDLDALIEELESNDPDAEVDEELIPIGGVRHVPEEMLQTDTRVGLIEPEVIARRKKYGLNQMREEKENLLLKFLGYFVGPIQFVMEVRISHHGCRRLSQRLLLLTIWHIGCCHTRRRSRRLGRFWCHLWPPSLEC